MTVGLLSLGVSPAATGRVQVNANSTQAVFKNFISGMGSYQVVNPTRADWPVFFNADQYPSGTLAFGASIGGTIVFPETIVAGTNLVVSWTGTCSGTAIGIGVTGGVYTVTAGGGGTFVGTINNGSSGAGTILTHISGSATLGLNMPISGGTVAANTVITALLNGTMGAVGASYSVNIAQLVGSSTLTGTGFHVGSGGFSLNLTGTNGYVEFNYGTTPYQQTLGFYNGATFTGFSNLIFCKQADYSAIVNATDASSLLTDDYIAAWKGLKPKFIRTMPWNDPNDGNNITLHKYRANWKTALAYSVRQWLPSTWAGGPGTAGPNITTPSPNLYSAVAATDTPASYTNGEVLQGVSQYNFQSRAIGGVASGTAGVVQITLGTTSIFGIANGNQVTVAGSGNTSSNGTWIVQNANSGAGTFELAGSTFVGSTSAAGSVSATLTGTVSGAVNNGSGLVRLTLNSIANIVNGTLITIAGVGGVSGAAGQFVVKNVGASGNSIDLGGNGVNGPGVRIVDSAFGGTYTSGGTWTINPGINVASRGTVPLLQMNGSSVTALGNNQLLTLIYDDIQSVYLVMGAGYGTDVGLVPLELQIGLANRVGCPLYVNFSAHTPYNTSLLEPTSSSITQAVQLCSNGLVKGAYFAWCNEVWNTSGSIDVNTNWAGFSGGALGFPNTIGLTEHIDAFYAFMVARIMPVVKAAWSSSAPLKRVLEFGGGAETTSAVRDVRCNGIDLAPSGTHTGTGNAVYSRYTSSADYTQSPNRPIDVCESISYATYYQGSFLQPFGYSANGAPKTITGVSTDTVGRLTFSADPGYGTGTRVNIYGISGTGTPPSGNITLSKFDATHYDMYTDNTLTTPISTASFAYTSGGTSNSYPGPGSIASAADLYAAGGSTNIASAFALMDADLISTGNPYGGINDLDTHYYPVWEAVAASWDGARPSGMSNVTIDCYEGGFQGIMPSAGDCTNLGIAGYATKLNNLMTAYKQSSNFQAVVTKQFNQFFGLDATSANYNTLHHSSTACWFIIDGAGNNQWSMYPGDIYQTPFSSYTAVANY